MPDLKQQVLLSLKKNQGRFLSGEALAKGCGVSRAAVWKAIRALTAEGCDIEAVTRLGYRLRAEADLLRTEEIRLRLTELGTQADVICFSAIDSTNTEARRRAQELSGPLLLAAEKQTAGRGRQGHSFYSPEGSGLYMTVALPIRLPLPDAALATQAMAVAALNAVRDAGGPELGIKWVNDLYYQGKKVAGILTEAISDLESGQTAVLLCGIGYNLTTSVFPEELAGKAGGIGRLNRNELAARTAAGFLRLAAALPDTSLWMDKYRERSIVLGRGLSFTQDGVQYRAVAEKIDERGSLVVRLADSSLRTLSSGEISILPDSLQ